MARCQRRIADPYKENREAIRMKKCQFCAEEVQNEAVKCKHCGERLDTDKIAQLEAEKKGNQFWGICFIAFAYVCVFHWPSEKTLALGYISGFIFLLIGISGLLNNTVLVEFLIKNQRR